MKCLLLHRNSELRIVPAKSPNSKNTNCHTWRYHLQRSSTIRVWPCWLHFLNTILNLNWGRSKGKVALTSRNSFIVESRSSEQYETVEKPANVRKRPGRPVLISGSAPLSVHTDVILTSLRGKNPMLQEHVEENSFDIVLIPERTAVASLLFHNRNFPRKLSREYSK